MIEKGFLTKLNWTDVLVILTILVTTYKGSNKKLIIAIFKTLGVVFSVYVSLHYFYRLSDFLLERFPVFGMFFSDLICFLSLFILSYLLVVLVREAFCRLIKVEAVSALDRWGGFLLGFLRGVLLASAIIVAFNLSFASYLQRSARKSYLGRQLVLVDIKTYEFIFSSLVAKFLPKEKLNKDIYEVFELESEGDKWIY